MQYLRTVLPIALASLGAGLLVGFVLWEIRVTEPLLDLRIFRLREFDVLLFGGSVGNIAYVSMVLLITMELQQVRGLSPLAAGCVFLAATASVVDAQTTGGMPLSDAISRTLTALAATAAVGATVTAVLGRASRRV